jgi:hypothetical protein
LVSFQVLEVANGEYGNITHQLSKSAIDNRWRSSQLCISNQYDTIDGLIDVSRVDNEMNNMRVLDMETQDMTSQKSIDAAIIAPSELCRMWILIQRCNIQLYRDWVIFLNLSTIFVYLFY